jgi:hypothetical protein
MATMTAEPASGTPEQSSGISTPDWRLPARELDRAYLAQTEVFAGIYRGLHARARGLYRASRTWSRSRSRVAFTTLIKWEWLAFRLCWPIDFQSVLTEALTRCAKLSSRHWISRRQRARLSVPPRSSRLPPAVDISGRMFRSLSSRPSLDESKRV